MASLNSIFNFLTSNILTRAELFVGLIILLGYILQRKKWYECVGGFFKGVIGYLILMVGANGRYVDGGVNLKKESAVMAAAGAEDTAADMNVMPGEMEVSANIKIVFSMGD